MVTAQFEPRLPADAGDVVGPRLLAVAAPLVQVNDVHASSVDYAGYRSQGEPVTNYYCYYCYYSIYQFVSDW